MVTKGKMLSKPPPFIKDGVLKGFYRPAFGPKKWELPIIEL